jgi:peptidoglycan hydrolase-like protein with peptidoglycan-binding domain
MKKLVVAAVSALLFVTPLLAVGQGVDQMLSKDMILLAESQLKVAGFDPGAVDGVFDAKTEAALMAYQKKVGLPPTGLLDGATRTALLPSDDGGES